MSESPTVRMRVTNTGEQYLGECIEYPIMTHGRTLEELAVNMEKAINLFLAEEPGDVARLSEQAVVAIKVTIPQQLK
jgi:predicted RNase H-like HicB family nuclease